VKQSRYRYLGILDLLVVAAGQTQMAGLEELSPDHPDRAGDRIAALAEGRDDPTRRRRPLARRRAVVGRRSSGVVAPG